MIRMTTSSIRSSIALAASTALEAGAIDIGVGGNPASADEITTGTISTETQSTTTMKGSTYAV